MQRLNQRGQLRCAARRFERRFHGRVAGGAGVLQEIAAFNVGNALSAWLGGLTIAAGLGFTSPIWMGAIVTAACLVVLLIAASADRSTTVAAPTDTDLIAAGV